ncbi:MAG: B12-binding domain-containing radical SAM protein [Lachnospiraceae bacterium]|nr:B12-binding domain-containing radical SAM protein [Lachnospiraceae bacterium]
MKFLLVAVNAKYIHSNPAVYSLYAYAKKDYADVVEIAEYTINQRVEDILAAIYDIKPDVIGFSCYIWNRNIIEELLYDLPKILPYADIWLGGPEVSYGSAAILEQFPSVRGIMVGEGEITFRELLKKYCGNDTDDFTSVEGLCLRSGFTPERKMTDLNKLPFLYQNTEPFVNRILYYESSRGCPYRCSYCLSSIDKTVRTRNIDTVKKELKFFLDNKVSQVKFVDRTFNCIHEHAMQIWEYLYENDNGITNFHFEISADIINDEELKLLSKFRPGQVQLEIGVQSVNEKTLAAINRHMNPEKLEYVVSKIKQNHNIHQHLDLIAGLPYEDYESFGKSFNRVYAMKPDQLQLGFLKVLRGTPISYRTGEFGIEYTKRPPYEVLCTKWISFAEIIRLKKIEELVEIYYNSNQFVNTLNLIVGKFDSPFGMFEKFADFYEENGYYVNSPKRIYRYEVLLDFLTKYDGINREVYIELLTYDVYLRENMKSRPDFSRSLNDEVYKKFRREFYRKEEKERYFLPNLTEYDSRQLSGMTHLEPFKYPVWDVDKMNKLISDPEPNFIDTDESEDRTYYLLFDYSVRNPLTGEALTIKMEGRDL